MQTNNEEAIHFYAKFGFGVSQTIPDYYKKNRLNPPDAHVLTRDLQLHDQAVTYELQGTLQ